MYHYMCACTVTVHASGTLLNSVRDVIQDKVHPSCGTPLPYGKHPDSGIPCHQQAVLLVFEQVHIKLVAAYWRQLSALPA